MSAARIPRPTRRTLLAAGLGAQGVAATASPAWSAGVTSTPAGKAGPSAASASDSVLSGQAFLDAMTDAYPTANPGVRLAQSYADELGLFSTAFVYDNALAICAYLAAGPARLARATREGVWLEHAKHARTFVQRMWNASGRYFHTGTNDGTTINSSPVPEDVQTWAWLALREERYAKAVDWAASALAVKDVAGGGNSQLPAGVSLRGVTFSNVSLTSSASYTGRTVHPQGVWLEGTGHLAAAYRDRRGAGDAARAAGLLDQMRTAQRLLGTGQHVGGTALPRAGGVVAASSLIDTGFGFGYFPVQHVGATSWYLMAALGANPYQSGGLGHH